MKIFAIKDETDKERKTLAYLLYFERDKKFYIELPENADPWETPLLLSGFASDGERTVNSYWSERWVRQRIVPTDRQNIGQILKENGLEAYDEYGLLMLSMGRCAQDDYYLVRIRENELPPDVLDRFRIKIEDVVPLENFNLLVFFRNGDVLKCCLKDYFEQNSRFSVLLRNPEYFENVQIQPGGYGIKWDDSLVIQNSALYESGNILPLTAADFTSFAAKRTVNAAETAELLNCSRQYVNELIRSGRLQPIKTSEKNTLFLKSEILKYLWK